MARNMHEALIRRASRCSGQTAIQWKKGGDWINISYGELHKNVLALSSALVSHYGIKRGDKVAMMLGNRPEWPTLFFALLCAGAVPVPVNSQGVSKEADNIIADSGCGIVFSESGCPSVSARTILVDSGEFMSAPGPSCAIPPIAKASRDDVACIMYTSGTTAHPKGVMLSHGNLLSNIHSLYKLGFMDEGDGVVSVLPLYHTYSMVVTTLGPLIYGGRVVYPGSIRSKEVMQAIRESGAKLFIGVPIVFEAFHKTINESIGKMPVFYRILVNSIKDLLYIIRKKTGINLARHIFYNVHQALGESLRVCMSGGAKLSEAAERELFKFGFTVLNGYGLTEASPVLTVNPLKRPKIGSAGLPIAGVEIKIVDKDENGIGEIFVRGPNIMKGYYKNEHLTRLATKDGWFRTKDMGRIDKDGYLYITGRVDDVITLKDGLSMHPDEIEEVYKAASPIKEICVFDVPAQKNANGAPVIWAVAVPDMAFFGMNGISDPYDAVKDAFKKISREISLPERLMGFSLTLDNLPRTMMGKVKRKDVKKRYLSGQIKEAFPPKEKNVTASDREVMAKPQVDKIIECLKTQTRAKDIMPGDSFELDLGIDLISRAELALELDRRLGLKINEDDMNRIFTVGELIEYAEKFSR